MPKNFVGEPFCAVFQKISDSEKVYGLEGGGEYQDFPSKFSFCLSVPKIFGGGGGWMLGESFSVSLILGIEKVRIRVGEYQVFPSKIVCLKTSKGFVREAFRV